MVDIEAEKKEIERTVKEALAAEDRKDLGTLMEFFTDDVIVQKSNIPQFQGIKALKEDYERIFRSLKGTSASTNGGSVHIEVSSSGDMAWDCGQYITEYKGPEGSRISKGKYLCTWKKVGDRWKIAAFSATSDLPAT